MLAWSYCLNFQLAGRKLWCHIHVRLSIPVVLVIPCWWMWDKLINHPQKCQINWANIAAYSAVSLLPDGVVAVTVSGMFFGIHWQNLGKWLYGLKMTLVLILPSNLLVKICHFSLYKGSSPTDLYLKEHDHLVKFVDLYFCCLKWLQPINDLRW